VTGRRGHWLLVAALAAGGACAAPTGQAGPPAPTPAEPAATTTSAPADPAGDPAATTTPAPADPAATTTPAPADPAAAVDPCALVTAAEAEALAGTPLDEPLRAPESCTYPGPVTGPTAQVEVFVGPGAEKILDIDRQLGHELRELPGIGDEAYAGEFQVFVNKAGTWVAVRLIRLEDPAAYRAALESVAATVASRL
jgi:hypothetical protein